MSKKIFRLTPSWDFEKEVNWINEMASKGMELKTPGLLFFDFEEGVPGRYQYALEFIDVRNKGMKEYFTFLEETGIEIVGQVGPWVYYRKANDGKPFEIFNDSESKIMHFKRILTTFIFITFFEVWLLFDSITDLKRGEYDQFNIFIIVTLSIVVLLLTSGIVSLTMKISKISKNRSEV